MNTSTTNPKIRTFTDMLIWKEGHRLVVLIYSITKTFPKSEIFSLINQMRRSTTSVTSNIAEGFARRSYKEKLQFYYLAHGSLTELKNQILISKDVGYLKKEDFETLTLQSDKTHQLLQGLITKTKTFIRYS